MSQQVSTTTTEPPGMSALTRIVSDLRMTARFVRLSVVAQLEYRADFVTAVAIGAIWQTSVVVFATVLITRFPGMGGWTQGDVLLIAAIRMTGHALASGLFMGARLVPDLTAEGRMDGFLLRPLPVYRQVMLSYFHIPTLGDLVVAVVLFSVALHHLELAWTPLKAAYLVAAVLGSMLLEASVQTFLGGFGLRNPAVAEWQEWAEELMSTFGNYPLHILPNLALGVFFSLLPIAFGAYLPAATLTGHTAALPVPAWLAAAAPAVSLGLFLLSRWWFAVQLRRYESVGG